ncbi:hypothetical protein IF188_04615 [Microbacterium sp. NEAU-LLC]|uniref:Uncharacterized protein n=1 Tax=Microbacterium helvum TaxID=2773713 RepID=A0ABR8NN93_9MICO|nr:hypothetical protein [Microbacterium helvum]MBD3940986.1 hypothetical protein [Microbacterium helvum]
MRDRRQHVLPLLVVLASGTLLLSACATGHLATAPTADDPGLLTTSYPVTVLDDGDGAELCLGGVLDSLPPQCGGPSLVDWDWAEHEGDYEESDGVRWGSFLVTGTYDADADSFTATDVIPGSDAESPQATMPDFSSPCPEPFGGWRVIDEAKATPESMDAVFQRAQRLPGYAAAWLDQSPNPASGTSTPDDPEQTMNDPRLSIVNVRVTGDPAAAEADLREVWGGMLCVTRAERTAGELQNIQDEIMESTDGVLSIGPNGTAGSVSVTVIHDDGTLQTGFDDRYGPGIVQVSSALVPAG